MIQKNKKGYTIIEILVTFSVLMIGLIGYLALAMKTLALEPLGKNKLIAVQLAQEGVEVVRNIRDTNWMRGDDFDHNLFDSSGMDPDYSMIVNYDTTGADIENIPNDYFSVNQIANPSARLYYDSTNESYKHHLASAGALPSGYKATNFRRIIQANPICDCIGEGCCQNDADRYVCGDGDSCQTGNEKIGIQVRSVVQWNNKGNNFQVEVVEQLYDWDTN